MFFLVLLFRLWFTALDSSSLSHDGFQLKLMDLFFFFFFFFMENGGEIYQNFPMLSIYSLVRATAPAPFF